MTTEQMETAAAEQAQSMGFELAGKIRSDVNNLVHAAIGRINMGHREKAIEILEELQRRMMSVTDYAVRAGNLTRKIDAEKLTEM